MNRYLRIITILLVFGTLTTLAQSPSTGAQLSGTILDPNGAAVPQAIVTLRSNTSAIEQSATSDVYGQDRFLLVPAGQYTLSVEAPGFSKLTDSGIVLTVGEVADLPIALQLAGVSQEVTVTGDASLIETQRTSLATTVDQQRIDNLPINGRNYINFTLTNS